LVRGLNVVPRTTGVARISRALVRNSQLTTLAAGLDETPGAAPSLRGAHDVLAHLVGPGEIFKLV
jgi:hypothetical protein